MKQIKLTFLLTVLMSMVGAKAFAYNIAVKNADGVEIYYNYINDGLELEVAESYGYRYMGNVVIPDEVTYMNRTRKVTSIGGFAFRDCSGLTSIEIPNSVKSIGNHAFYNCSSLTSIVIPNSVTSIGDYAFSGCSGLTSIEIPNSVTSIGSSAFYKCSGLTAIEIPNSVTSIRNYAFEGCSGLTSIVIPNSVTSIGDYAFSGCSGLTSIEIPNSVTSISSSAFYKCSGLTAIEIPNSVTSIGDYAFEDCSGLSSIVIPNSVTSIGSSAFYKCSGLTAIEIPNSVTSIGEGAFQNCSGLTYIVIPNSVTSIGSGTFSDCSGLTAIVIPNSVTSIGRDAFNNCSGLTSVVIPNSVTSIGDYAFSSCSGLTFLICLAESVPTTGSYAFDRSSIRSATLHVPAGSKAAYEAADVWKDFNKIVEIDDSGTCGDNVSYVFEEATGTLIISGAGAMSDDSSSYPWSSYRDNIKKIVLNYGVASVGSGAFSGCSGLISVTCQAENAPTIDSHAFDNSPIGSAMLYVPNGCKAAYETADVWKDFKEIVAVYDSGTCGDNVSYVFDEATGTLTISGTGAMQDYYNSSSAPWSSYKSDIKKLVLNEGVTSIGDWAFYNCSGLTSIEIPNSVTSIGDYAFRYCRGLTSIEIPNSVTSIGEGAFYNCSSLTSIEIPNSVTSIGNHAFSGCSGLTSIEIPNSVTSIGNYAFQFCSGLTAIKVESGNTKYDSRNNCNAIIESSSNTLIAGCENTIIPNSVTSIGDEAFYNCSGLTSIKIPNSVTSIGTRTFSGCSGLTSINVESGNTKYDSRDNCNAIIENSSNTLIAGCKNTIIPNSVTSIGEAAFFGCSGLTSIEIPKSVTSIGEGAFSGCSGLTSIEIPNSVTSIGNYAFYGCSGLTSIEIPNSVTSIGESAFSGCSGLTSIEIPNSVTSIGNHAFSGCSGLTSIEIPNSVTSIGNYAISGCSGLTSIVIPNSVTSIGNYAFYNCTGLTSIEIPNSVTSIRGYAFGKCSGLTSVTCLAESVPTIHSNVFYNSSIESAALYVPVGSKAAYEAADVWKDFKEIVEIEVTPTPSSDALLSVQNTKGYIGKTVSVDIDLNNSTEDLTAYQFDLTLPDGISLSVNDKGKFLVTKTSRYEDDSQTLNISKLEGNTYRFVCFSMSNEVITGTSGAILNASLTIGESVNEGSYEATISNIVVTKTDGTQLKLSDSKFNIVVTNVIKGDANGDGEVNVSDIVEIVNYIMNKPSDKFVFAAADVNEDGEVNVTDIVKVVSIIMSANSSQAKMGAAQTEMTDNDQVQLVDNEDQTISLTLNNEGGYVASQFDLVLSDNQSLESITLNNNRTDNHILAYTKTGANRYRVLSYSLNNATYDGHSGELLDIKVAGSGDVSVEDILFVTAGETEKRFSPLHSGTTGISVTTKQAEAMDIYSVDGRLVHKQAKSMDGLERGIYIINGKKHIVR